MSKKQKLCPEERALRAARRLACIKAGAGDYGDKNRPLAIKETEAVLDTALAEIRRGLGQELRLS